MIAYYNDSHDILKRWKIHLQKFTEDTEFFSNTESKLSTPKHSGI